MTRWEFFRQCWTLAFAGAWGWLGGISTVLGVLLPLFVFAVNRFLPPDRRAWSDRIITSPHFQQAIWLIPLVTGLVILVLRLFVFAPYAISKRETTKRDGEIERQKAEIEKLTGVNVSIRFDQYGIGEAGEGPDRKAGLLIFLSVRNLGIETALEGWTLKIQTPDGVILEDQPTVLSGSFSAGSATFALPDHLIMKTAVPLTRGSITKGILLFMLEPSAASLVRPGSKLVVTCTDVVGGTHRSEHVVTGAIGREVFPFVPEGRASDLTPNETQRPKSRKR